MCREKVMLLSTSEEIYHKGISGTRAIIETQDKVDIKEYERVVLALIELYLSIETTRT